RNMRGIQLPDLPLEIRTESGSRARVAREHTSAAVWLKLPSSQDRNFPAAGLVGKASYITVTAAGAVLVGDRGAFQERQESADRARLDAVNQVVPKHARRISQAIRMLAGL